MTRSDLHLEDACGRSAESGLEWSGLPGREDAGLEGSGGSEDRESEENLEIL